MKKLILLCAFGLALSTDAVAQGFLKKLKGAVDNTVKTAQKLQGGGNQDNAPEGDAGSDDEYDENGFKRRKLPDMPKSNIVPLKGYNEFTNKFTLKTTPSTKIIQLDDIKDVSLGYFYDERAFVQTSQNGTLCIDPKGNTIKTFTGVVIPDDLAFNSGRVIMSTGYQEYTVYDTNFNVIKVFKKTISAEGYMDGVAVMVETKNGSTVFAECEDVYVDVNGNKLFSGLIANSGSRSNVRQPALRPLRDGLSAFLAGNGEVSVTANPVLWGFRDAKGNVVVKPKYYLVRDFSNGLAAVCAGDNGTIKKWGFIDKTGKEVIAPMYTVEPTPFDVCGLSMVTNKDGKNMFIDKTGKVVSGMYGGRSFDNENAELVTPFCNGKALLESDGITYLIDSKFNKLSIVDDGHLIKGIDTYRGGGMTVYGSKSAVDFVLPVYADRYASVRAGVLIREGRIYLNFGGMCYGLLSDSGNIECARLAGPFINGIAPVNMPEEGAVGYVNDKGEWLVKFERNDF